MAGGFYARVATKIINAACALEMIVRRPQSIQVSQSIWPPDLPLVSIIIPCYNYGQYLHGAISSVHRQTFQRYEIIVIDDGSTDPLTHEVIKNLQSPKTRVISQTNRGLAETRNIGARLSFGKYLCYLDADHFIDPTYLEKTLGVLESDETIGSCFSWVKCFGDTDSLWKTEHLNPHTLYESTTASSHSVIRKEAWEAVRRFNGAGFLSKYDGYFEDWVFWIDMVQSGYRGHVIREALIFYRVHRQSLGAIHKAGFADMLRVLHQDRADFFGSRSHRRKLAAALNKRRYITNKTANL
jgi:glycosyltransferase involved in cell wall biosynthesis